MSASEKEELLKGLVRPLLCGVIIASCLLMTASGIDYPWYWDAAGLGYFGLFNADRILDHRASRKALPAVAE